MNDIQILYLNFPFLIHVPSETSVAARKGLKSIAGILSNQIIQSNITAWVLVGLTSMDLQQTEKVLCTGRNEEHQIDTAEKNTGIESKRQQ